ncbi:MAG: hemolysin family protein [Bacteroidetes bacterium]|nr:hemolysin family protein [Rhodothermia bacterium]MCX7907876.1 hemolysin family protein [Bacteroidota bacterium]MDW8284719.1 hemolysin family protein [Bacteroidota bacterium]
MGDLVLALLGLLLAAFCALFAQAYGQATRAWAELMGLRTPKATAALELLRHPDWYRHGAWLGRILGGVAYAWGAWGALEPHVGQLWVFLLEPYRTLCTGLSGAVLLGVAYYVLAWLLPSLAGRYGADRLVLPLAYPGRALVYLFYPLIYALGRREEQGLGDPPLDLAPQTTAFPDPAFSESLWLERVLALGERRLKDLMVPRTEIEALEEHSSVSEAIARFRQTGYSRLPVYRGTIDTIIGLVKVQDLFRRPERILDVLRPVLFAPESKPAAEMLLEFRRTGQHMAIVLDEYGGTAGLITLEDLLEELVGDIQDEYDEEELVLRRLNPHTFILSGRASVEELNARFRLGIPEGDYETLAGYIMDRLGVIPKVNEEFVLDDRFRVIITRATPSRIDLVKLILLSPQERA